MKKLIQILVLAVAPFMMNVSANAQDATVKVPVEYAAKSKVKAVELYDGFVVEAKNIKGHRGWKIDVEKLMQQDEIELKEGIIIYPKEEVEFAHVSLAPEVVGKAPHQKEPHTQD